MSTSPAGASDVAGVMRVVGADFGPHACLTVKDGGGLDGDDGDCGDNSDDGGDGVDEGEGNEEDDIELDKQSHLLRQVGEQLDYYFGDTNYRSDRFLRSKEDKDRFIDAEVICGFKKLKTMVGPGVDVTPGLLVEASVGSDVLEVQTISLPNGNDRVLIRRQTPLEDLPEDPRPMTARIEEVHARLKHIHDRKSSGSAHGIFLKGPLNQLVALVSKAARNRLSPKAHFEQLFDGLVLAFDLIESVKDVQTRFEVDTSIDLVQALILNEAGYSNYFMRSNVSESIPKRMKYKARSLINSARERIQDLRREVDKLKHDCSMDLPKAVDESLSKEIVRQVAVLAQNDNVMLNLEQHPLIQASLKLPQSKESIRATLQSLFRNHGGSGWETCKLEPYGSSVTGLGFSTSDIDLCLTIGTDADVSQATCDAGFSSAVVCCMESILISSEQDQEYTEIEAVTGARVPILKLKHKKTSIECDICINQHLGIHNSSLLKTYTMVDARVKPLVLAVKHWAKQRGICESNNGTLSSYAWVIMVIRHLQMCTPPVLPNLQDPDLLWYTRLLMGDEVASPGSGPNIVEGFDVSFSHRLDAVEDMIQSWISPVPGSRRRRRLKEKGQPSPSKRFKCSCGQSYGTWKELCIHRTKVGCQDNFEKPKRNSESVASLFVGFFKRYAFNFDLINSVVCVHASDAMPPKKSQIAKEHPLIRPRNWRVCIQDPFEKDHDLGSVIFSPSASGYITQQFYNACKAVFTMRPATPNAQKMFENICEPVDAVKCGTVDCFNCGERGHPSARCPERTVVSNSKDEGNEDDDKVSSGKTAQWVTGDDLSPEDPASKRPLYMQYAPLCFRCGEPHHNSVNCPLANACFTCGKPGHKSSQCPNKRQPDQQQTVSWVKQNRILTCHRCGKPGHKASNCPEQRRKNQQGRENKEYSVQSADHDRFQGLPDNLRERLGTARSEAASTSASAKGNEVVASDIQVQVDVKSSRRIVKHNRAHQSEKHNHIAENKNVSSQQPIGSEGRGNGNARGHGRGRRGGRRGRSRSRGRGQG